MCESTNQQLLILIIVNSSYGNNGMIPFPFIIILKKSCIDRIFQYHCLFLNPVREKLPALPGLDDNPCRITEQESRQKPHCLPRIFLIRICPDRNHYRYMKSHGGEQRHNIVLTDKYKNNIRSLPLPYPAELMKPLYKIENPAPSGLFFRDIRQNPLCLLI